MIKQKNRNGTMVVISLVLVPITFGTTIDGGKKMQKNEVNERSVATQSRMVGRTHTLHLPLISLRYIIFTLLFMDESQMRQ